MVGIDGLSVVQRVGLEGSEEGLDPGDEEDGDEWCEGAAAVPPLGRRRTWGLLLHRSEFEDISLEKNGGTLKGIRYMIQVLQLCYVRVAAVQFQLD